MARKIYGIAIDKSLFQGPIDINSMKGSFSELLDSCGLSVLLIKGLPNYTAGIDALFHPIDIKKNLDINNCILFLFLEGYDEYKILCFKERFKEILRPLDRRAPPYFVKKSGTIEYLYEDKYILNRPTLFELNIYEEQERRRLEQEAQREVAAEKARQEKLRQEEARLEEARQEQERKRLAVAEEERKRLEKSSLPSMIFDDNRGLKKFKKPKDYLKKIDIASINAGIKMPTMIGGRKRKSIKSIKRKRNKRINKRKTMRI